MRTEPPADRLRRLLSAGPENDRADTEPGGRSAPEDDPDSLLPAWLPDGSPADGWLAKVRADPGRAGAVALAVIATVAVLITVFTVLRDQPLPVMSAKLPPVEMVSATSPNPSADPGPDSSPHPDPDRLVVSVVGLVHNPGLATLSAGARVADALTAAGGALAGADTVGLNLARQVADGEQIVVGLAPRLGLPSALGSSARPGSSSPTGPNIPGSPAVTSAPAKPGRSSSPVKPGRPGAAVNLNTATVDQLDALPGVGPVTAAAIVAWRDVHGRFGRVDQLGEVDGIGPARLEKLRPLVRV